MLCGTPQRDEERRALCCTTVDLFRQIAASDRVHRPFAVSLHVPPRVLMAPDRPDPGPNHRRVVARYMIWPWWIFAPDARPINIIALHATRKRVAPPPHLTVWIAHAIATIFNFTVPTGRAAFGIFDALVEVVHATIPFAGMLSIGGSQQEMKHVSHVPPHTHPTTSLSKGRQCKPLSNPGWDFFEGSLRRPPFGFPREREQAAGLTEHSVRQRKRGRHVLAQNVICDE